MQAHFLFNKGIGAMNIKHGYQHGNDERDNSQSCSQPQQDEYGTNDLCENSKPQGKLLSHSKYKATVMQLVFIVERTFTKFA